MSPLLAGAPLLQSLFFPPLMGVFFFSTESERKWYGPFKSQTFVAQKGKDLNKGNAAWEQGKRFSPWPRVNICPEQTRTALAFIVQSWLVSQKSWSRVWQGHRLAWCAGQVGGQAPRLLGRSKLGGLEPVPPSPAAQHHPAAVVPAHLPSWWYHYAYVLTELLSTIFWPSSRDQTMETRTVSVFWGHMTAT